LPAPSPAFPAAQRQNRLSELASFGSGTAEAGSLAFSPDASPLFYQADERVDGGQEPLAAPSDGSAEPSPFGDIFGFTPDGAWRAGHAPHPGLRPHLAAPDRPRAPEPGRYAGRPCLGRATPGQWELFSVPLDGSLAPIRLNAPLAAPGDVIDLRISGDSTRVAYLTDQEVDHLPQTFEVFTAPIDGSQPAVQVSRIAPGPPAGRVEDFAVLEMHAAAPAGRSVWTLADSPLLFARGHLLFLAGLEHMQLVELFSTPLLPPGRAR
jgi:hypothetical protein